MSEKAPDRQWLVVGPPGTGKTTFLARQAERAAQKYGSDKVMLSSFTKAAAAEIAGRHTPINREMIGTLHSFAFRSLGMPKITESIVKEWNASHSTRQKYLLSDSLSKDEPESGGATEGDEIYAKIQVYRARMLPESVWTPEMREFWQEWCNFKRETDSMDFTDLIEIAARDVAVAPGNPTVGFFDEAQDFTRLEFSLVKRWSKNMEFFFIVGDSDQCIYTFKGSDPNIFLDPPTPEEHTRVLSQSYRVPRQIHALAVDWIQRLSKRYPSNYLPRDFDGEIQAPSQITFKDAQRLLDHAGYFLDAGKTVMFLGACGFHVEPIVREMRRQGIPFHNPYRRAHGGWNPLRQSRKGTGTTDRIRAFLAGSGSTDGKLWTADELQKWVGLVKADGVLVRGAKTAIGKLDNNGSLTARDIRPYFTEIGFNAACSGDTQWLRQNLSGAYEHSARYALDIVERRGIKGLTETPKVIVGTIHSVKGGESAVVYVDPSMAPSMMREWYDARDGFARRDAIIRQYYVALTRASETLVLCRGTGTSVPIPTHAPKMIEEEL